MRKRISVAKELLVACTSMSCPCPGLVVCAPRALLLRLCRAQQARYLPSRHGVARAGLRTPSSVVGDRTFCRGRPCRDLKILYRNRNFSNPGQLCSDIELFYRDIFSSCLGQLCRDIEIFCRNRILLAWPTLSRLKNTPSRQKIPLA